MKLFKHVIKRAEKWYSKPTENNKANLIVAYEGLNRSEKKEADKEIHKLMPIWSIETHLEF